MCAHAIAPPRPRATNCDASPLFLTIHCASLAWVCRQMDYYKCIDKCAVRSLFKTLA